MVDHVDRASFCRSARLWWVKHCWRCVTVGGSLRSWTETAAELAVVEHLVTTRAALWMCRRAGEHGRTFAGVTTDLGCDWYAVNDTVL